MSMFVQAVERGSLSAVARERGIPLPTVSRLISDLEAHLGAKLLIRSTRRLDLTDAGAAYLGPCRRILEQVEDAERAAAGEYSMPKGELVVAAPVLFGRLHVLPVALQFLAEFPEIRVRLLLSDGNVHLLEEQVDLAVRIGPLADTSLVARRVGSVRWVVGAAPALIARHGEPVHPDDLRSMPVIGFDPGPAHSAWQFQEPATGSAMTVEVLPRLSVTTAESALDAAVEAVGAVRLLDYQCLEAVTKGALVLLLEQFAPEALPVQLLHRSREQLPLKTRLLLDFAASQLRARLAMP